MSGSRGDEPVVPDEVERQAAANPGTDARVVAEPPPAGLRRRSFSFVWLIPLVAAVIAVYLGYRTLIQQGPLMTVTFATGEGLSEGQTQVKYKNVALGTVESIDLARDNRNVVVRVRMNNIGARFLDRSARYWVVRPQFSLNNISGLDTLVSGAYIAVDPGKTHGPYQDHFVGLEEAPGVRSDEPGQTYQLKTQTIGSISAGSPIFYRDIVVGEVLSYDVGDGLGPITVSIFVRDPFDKLIRASSHFWKSSGITAGLQGGGFHVEFQSLQALLSGGVTFDVPDDVRTTPPAPDNAVFPLYESMAEAAAAGYQQQIPMITYFDSSVAGLKDGSPVNVLGIQVGIVRKVQLIVDPLGTNSKVRVEMALQPERALNPADFNGMPPQQALQNMVAKGLRAQLETESYITSQMGVALTFVPNAKPASLSYENGTAVIPSQPAMLQGILTSAQQIMAEVQKIPFEQIGKNANKLLVTTNNTIGSKEVKQTLVSLQDTLKQANATLKGLSQSYGGDSDFQVELEQLISQANDALRSIKQLSDYLDRHPASLIFGRSHGQ